jgi:hypothetical protein
VEQKRIIQGSGRTCSEGGFIELARRSEAILDMVAHSRFG